MRKYFLTVTTCLALMAMVSCGSPTSQPKDVRIDALDNAAWDASEWISVANAPVVTGAITGTNERAADGASWFVSTLKNEKKVTAARWMTTGLGVYEL